MSIDPPTFGNLINRRKGMRYEFVVQDAFPDIVVHRVWLSDGEREFMGRYNNAFAVEFWDGLTRDGFVPEEKEE